MKHLRIIVPIAIFVIVVLCSIVYTTIQNKIGINSNGKIISEIEQLIESNKNDFIKINDFLINTPTNSLDYKRDYHSRQGITYYSYKKRVKNISLKKSILDSTKLATPKPRYNYVPDFELPESIFQTLMIKNNLSRIRVEENCSQMTITYRFKYRHFYPTNRDILLKFYPQGICDSVSIGINRDPSGYDWNYIIDESWIIISKKAY